MVGRVQLGFSSVYREGFETVLFLQALVLNAGTIVVLQGAVVGLLALILQAGNDLPVAEALVQMQ
jgi:high-affinity iron transporter